MEGGLDMPQSTEITYITSTKGWGAFYVFSLVLLNFYNAMAERFSMALIYVPIIRRNNSFAASALIVGD